MHPGKNIYEALIRSCTGIVFENKPVQIYSGVLPVDVEGPYILINSVECVNEENKTDDIWRCRVEILVITHHLGNSGTEGDAFDIETQLWPKIENIYVEQYENVVIKVDSSNTLKEYSDGVLFAGRTINVTILI
jgi:hypothetical protein